MVSHPTTAERIAYTRPPKKTKKQTRAFLSRHIKKHEKEYDMPKKQAVAVALNEARHKGYPISKRFGFIRRIRVSVEKR